jgi:molybdopterin/thiamine biosynthesis adenylyltransferase
MIVDDSRFHRQELLFGKRGQEKILRCKVGIVGLGGLGSHVAQQLAYLGVTSFVLVDQDKVSESNLNRLIGATEDDVAYQALKVDIARRLIKAILRAAHVDIVSRNFISAEAFDHLRTVDFVFGCVDNDASRLVLNEFCQAYARGYIDIATDIFPKDGAFGGRMLFSDGRVCLSCKGLLDDDAVRDSFSTDRQRQDEERIYGVRRSALGQTGPAVVSLNGVLASMAVTEFMAEVTGIRRAYLHLEYNGAMGIVTRDPTLPDFDCYYCRTVRGKEQAADVERYIREGWGERLGIGESAAENSSQSPEAKGYGPQGGARTRADLYRSGR